MLQRADSISGVSRTDSTTTDRFVIGLARSETIAEMPRKLRRRVERYPPHRMKIAALCEGHALNVFISGVIVCNVATIIFETNFDSTCRGEGNEYCILPTWLRIGNIGFLLIYTTELVARIYAYRSDFYHSTWNLIDLFVVTTGIIDVLLHEIAAAGDLPNLSFLRVFRITRLLRAFRLLSASRELYLLLHGFVASMRSIFWGSIMMIVLFMMWSILAVEAIGPTNQLVIHTSEYCETAFKSVWQANLWFFQTIMAGDSWSECARPIMVKEPWTFLIFFGAFATVLMGFGNLILAVIVARAEEARHDDVKRRMKDKAIYEQKELSALLLMCHEIDLDDSGGVTSSELLHAYDNHEELSTMLRLMDIGRQDLECIYRLIDEDGTDHVLLTDFVSKLHRIKENNVHTTTMFIKSQMHQMFQVMQESKDTLMTKLDQLASPKCERSALSYTQPYSGGERLTHLAQDLEAALQQRRDEFPTLLPLGAGNCCKSYCENLKESGVCTPDADDSPGVETDIPFGSPLVSVPALVFDPKFMPLEPLIQSVHAETLQVELAIAEILRTASQNICRNIEHQHSAFTESMYRRGVSHAVAMPKASNGECWFPRTP